MNIFYLSRDPVLCAEMHCDKHVNKMIIEKGVNMYWTGRRIVYAS